MENQRTFTIMLVMAAQCCLGVLSSSRQLTDSCVVEKCPEEAYKGFKIATTAAFDFLETKLTELIKGSKKKVCQHTSYELMRVKDKMFSGSVRGLYTVVDRLECIETSLTVGISRNDIELAVIKVIDALVETFKEILNAYCNNYSSGNKSQILDNIKERRNSLPSGTTTVVKSLFIRIRNNPAIPPGMETVFNHTETKAIAICVKALDQIFVGGLTMLDFFLGSTSESEDYLCKLYEALNISLKSFRRESNILCEIVKLYAFIFSEKKADRLVDDLTRIQMGQDMIVNNLQAGLKMVFDTIDWKIRSAYGVLDNNTGYECCKFDMAEEKTYSYFNAAYQTIRYVDMHKETAWNSMANAFALSESVNKLSRYVFNVMRLSNSTSDFEMQYVYDSSRNLSLSEGKNLGEILNMLVKNGQKYPDYVQALLNESETSAAMRAEGALVSVYRALKIMIDALRGTRKGYNDSQASVDRYRTDANSELHSQSEDLCNSLRLLAVYTSTEDRQSTMNFSQIQISETPTCLSLSTGIEIIFNEMISLSNNIDYGNNSSTNHSIADLTDASNKTTNELLGAANTILSLITGAASAVKSAQKKTTVFLTDAVKAIFDTLRLVYYQDCKGLLARIDKLEKQAASNGTAAMATIFEAISYGLMNDTPVDTMMKQYTVEGLEKTKNIYDKVFTTIKIVAGRCYPTTTIANNSKVMIINNIRSTCKIDVKDRVFPTLNAIRLRFAVNLIRRSRITDGFSVIETQRQKAHAGANGGFGAFYDMFHNNTCSPNCSRTGMIDHAEHTMYISFRIMSECAFYAMKTVLPGCSSTVATVEGSTYAAMWSIASSLFSIMRSIQQNKVSGILEEIDIMQHTADCLGQAVIKSWYLPLIECNRQLQQNNAEIRPELNNTMSALLNVNNHVIGSMFNELKCYLETMSPETCSQSVCSPNSMKNQEIMVEYQTESIIDSLFDTILLTFVSGLMNNAKTTAQPCWSM